MKSIILLISTFFVTVAGTAQIKDPVKWNYAATKKGDKVYEITFTADVQKPWHIYSQSTPKGGPVPTKFVFKTNPIVKVNGAVKETGAIKTIHDEIFGVDVTYFESTAVFTQTVNLKSTAKTNIAGTIEYMVCNDKECLPPKKVSFDLALQ